MTDHGERRKSSQDRLPILKSHEKRPDETDKMHKVHEDWATKWAKILIKDKDDYMLLILDNLLTGISKNKHEGIDTSNFVYLISLRLIKKK